MNKLYTNEECELFLSLVERKGLLVWLTYHDNYTYMCHLCNDTFPISSTAVTEHVRYHLKKLMIFL